MAKVEKAVDLILPKGPFISRKNYEGQKGFDKYYLDVTEKDVFKETGEVDLETGDKLGVIEKKLIIKKVNIQEFLNAQAASVGIDFYIQQLALQGVNINECSTSVDKDKIQDFSEMPDNLADVLTAGDKARDIFANLDPELKGNHTTIEGFLNSLIDENVLKDYIMKRLNVNKVPEIEKGENN